jgi:beta-phosphoglucomutase-like phosphatase (HAD superfamily)
MDGTLTMPGAINFGKMYERVGVDRKNGDIILQVQAMPTEQEREAAYSIILEEELSGIERMKLRPGLAELLELLYRHRVRVAIATRNCQLALEKFVETAEIEQHR